MHTFLLIAIAFTQIVCTNATITRPASSKVQVFNGVNSNGLVTIIGSVSNVLGSQIVTGADITLWNVAVDTLKPDTTVFADNENHFKLLNITPGEYKIRAWTLGCKPQEVRNLHVARNQQVVIDFVLDTTKIHFIKN